MKLVLQISSGVILGNLVTLAIVASLVPYVKVERKIVNSFFRV
jgi:hypothetical protein